MPRPVALVTGASVDMSRELATQLVQEGHNLVLVARSEDKLQQLAADLGRPGSAQALFDSVQEKNIAVDVLVNNTGFGLKGRFVKLSLAEQQEMIQMNITTLTELC